jgi:Ser/Thr protein kinase RdoA (MazF antagonist)
MTLEMQVKTVLSAYGLESATITTLRHLGNYVAKVEQSDVSYGLRICVPETKLERLQVERKWLRALSRDTDLIVPQPIKNKSGEWITTLSDRKAILFSWIEGEPVSRHMSVGMAAHIGKLMAILHEHTQHYQPQHYVGPIYDAAWLNGKDSWWQTRAVTDIGEETFKELGPSIEGLAKYMKALKNAKHFGLIHSDLHFGNMITHDGNLNVIDFDGCALGYYAFDIALTEWEFTDFDNSLELIEAFRESYQQHSGQTISKDADVFRIATCVTFLEWVFTSPNPNVREEKMEWVGKTLEDIRKAGELL